MAESVCVGVWVFRSRFEDGRAREVLTSTTGASTRAVQSWIDGAREEREEEERKGALLEIFQIAKEKTRIQAASNWLETAAQDDQGGRRTYDTISRSRTRSHEDTTYNSTRPKIYSTPHRTIPPYLPNPLNPSTRRTSLVNLSESSIGRRSSRHSSLGSLIHPSIGIPFARFPCVNERSEMEREGTNLG